MGSFDHINHQWLLAHIPINKKVLQQWLKAGVLEQGQLKPTISGTPQGGIISPLLMNMTLDGLETRLKAKFKAKAKVHLIRYADDFIITGTSEQILAQEVLPLVQAFLQERGLSLSPEKTRITHIERGFDFLGFNLRKYQGKLLIKPAKKSLKAVLEKLRTIIKAHPTASPGDLLGRLNPILRGWVNYYRHQCSKQTFAYLDHQLWWMLWRWAKRRHPHKPHPWILKKYFQPDQGHSLRFFGFCQTPSDKWTKVYLFLCAKTPIRRHVKIRALATPFDPLWEPYFEQRLDQQMLQSLHGRQRLRSLWFRQNGLCPICNQKMTVVTGWHTHHRLAQSQGGDDTLDNLVLLHPVCHQQVHCLKLSLSLPRLLGGV